MADPKDAEEAEKLAAHAADTMVKYPNYIADHLRRQNAILGANMSPRMSPTQRLAAQLDGGQFEMRHAPDGGYEFSPRESVSVVGGKPRRLGSASTGCEPQTPEQQIAELWKLVGQKNQQLKDERTALHNRVAECRALRSELRLMRRVMRLKAEVAAESCEFDCKAKGSHRACPIHGERAP